MIISLIILAAAAIRDHFAHKDLISNEKEVLKSQRYEDYFEKA